MAVQARDVTVAAAQLAVEQCWADPEALDGNAEKIARWYDGAADEADLVVFPELCLTGYIPLKGYDPPRKRLLFEVSKRAFEEVLPRLVERTRGRRAALVVGLMEPSVMRHEMFNSLALIDDGDVRAVHRKVHLPVEESHYFVPGSDVTVADARCGSLALIVCYDMLFPETARLAALKGAEILVVSSNWLAIANLERLGEILPVARALEEQLHVVFVNGVGDLEARGRRWRLFGQSRIVSATGDVLAVAGRDEECLMARLTSEDLARAADVFPVLRDRRPETYQALTSPLARFAPEVVRR